MNPSRIESALKEIESNFAGGDAKVRFDVYGGGVDESFVRGSRAGIARLGIRFIRAAIAEECGKSINGGDVVSRTLDDVIHPSSDVKLDWIEIMDDLEDIPEVQVKARESLNRVRWIGCMSVVVAMLTFFLVSWLIK